MEEKTEIDTISDSEKSGNKLVIYKDWFETPPQNKSCNKEVLEKIVREYGLKLIGKYDKVNQRSKISGFCRMDDCVEIWQKNFDSLIRKGGPFCEKHVYALRKQKARRTRERKQPELVQTNVHIVIRKNWLETQPKVTLYTKNTLMKLVSDYGLELINEYKNDLNRETGISGFCLWENCRETWEKKFYSLIKGCGPFCKKHSKTIWADKSKKTNLAKLGVETPFHSAKIQQKIRQNRLERSGVENPAQLDEVKEKTRQTVLAEYGVENVSQVPEFKEKRKQTTLARYNVEHIFHLKEFREKAKQTTLARYNVEHIFQLEEFKEKRRQTFLDKYNVEYPLQVEEFKEKSKQTCLDRYGFIHASMSEYVQQKVEETCLERYGVTNPSHTEDVKDKIRQRLIERYNNGVYFYHKPYTLPSGKIVYYQGYENFTWDFLLFVMGFDENDILVGKDVPVIEWFDTDGSKHLYYCDHYIPKKNLLIETKSDWTFELAEEKNLLKQKYAKKAGFKHQILIWNSLGEIEDIVE